VLYDDDSSDTSAATASVASGAKPSDTSETSDSPSSESAVSVAALSVAGDKPTETSDSPSSEFGESQPEFIITGDDGRELAKVFLPREQIEDETLKQITAQCKSCCVEHVRIMPDCHVGSGAATVGFTARLRSPEWDENGALTKQDRIDPSLIGVDIGCGLSVFNIGKRKLNMPSLDKLIRSIIPIGAGGGANGGAVIHPRSIATLEELADMSARAQAEAIAFAKAYQEKYKIDISKYIPIYNPAKEGQIYSGEWFHQQCKMLGCNFDMVCRSLASLGGGNHFLEVNLSETGDQYISIHCGSRNYGKRTCDYFMEIIHPPKKNVYDEYAYDKDVARLKKLHKKQKDILAQKLAECQEKLNSSKAAKHPPFLENDDAWRYYFSMIHCQQYARLNRHMILTRILEGLGIEYDPSKEWESIHNYIDFSTSDFIVRKGAVSAKKDEIVLVGLTMADGILIAKGKGNPDFNYSGPHGLGRVLARGEAFKRLKLKDFKSVMDKAGVWSSSVSASTLDESPAAYKPLTVVTSCVGGTMSLLKQLRPTFNLKG
jgi:RNA-splicing ligase RtcB